MQVRLLWLLFLAVGCPSWAPAHGGDAALSSLSIREVGQPLEPGRQRSPFSGGLLVGETLPALDDVAQRPPVAKRRRRSADRVAPIGISAGAADAPVAVLLFPPAQSPLAIESRLLDPPRIAQRAQSARAPPRDL
jgi:hypothetical protein